MPIAYSGRTLNPQTVWSNPPEQIHYDIADWALSGNKLFAAMVSWYYNPFFSFMLSNYFLDKDRIIF
jgi:hypothetical protein